MSLEPTRAAGDESARKPAAGIAPALNRGITGLMATIHANGALKFSCDVCETGGTRSGAMVTRRSLIQGAWNRADVPVTLLRAHASEKAARSDAVAFPSAWC
jgi:hypothetical protein